MPHLQHKDGQCDKGLHNVSRGRYIGSVESPSAFEGGQATEVFEVTWGCRRFVFEFGAWRRGWAKDEEEEDGLRMSEVDC